MAEACEKAKKQATQLAAAAGMKPGRLMSLQGGGSSSSDDDDYGSYGAYRAMFGGGGSSADDDEAVGANYGP